MKKATKLVSLLLSLGMVLTMAGCGDPKPAATNNQATGKTESSAATSMASTEGTGGTDELDLTERVDLVFYVMGDEPAGKQAVQAELNKILLDRLNRAVYWSGHPCEHQQQYGEDHEKAFRCGGR